MGVISKVSHYSSEGLNYAEQFTYYAHYAKLFVLKNEVKSTNLTCI